MRKALIILSVLLNVALIGALYYVACVKTDFSKRMIAKIMHEAYVPERSDNGCVDSWNNCVKKLDMKVDAVFFGDSHTAGGDWHRAFPDIKSINLGYIGEDVKGMLRRVEAIAAVHPKKVFLMVGINGLKYQSLDDFEFWFAAVVDSIRAAVPEAELYTESILPVTGYSDYCDNGKVKEANDIVRKIAIDRNIPYIDLYSEYAHDGALPDTLSYDGLHLKPEAYSTWYECVEKLVK